MVMRVRRLDLQQATEVCRAITYGAMTRVRFTVLVAVAAAISACSGNTSGGLFDPPTTVTVTAAPETARVFKQEAVQDGVTKILKERYNEDASDVHCPEDQPVKKGHRFDCTLKVNGDSRTVTIT